MSAPPPVLRPATGRWRLTLRRLHRDTGYLVAGLTVAYAISGLAANHHHQWDYQRTRTRVTQVVGRPAELGLALEGPQAIPELEQAPRLAAAVAQRLQLPPPKNAFWRSPRRLELFPAGSPPTTVSYTLDDGVATVDVTKYRPFLRPLNRLHLNELRGAWTGIADLFAAALIFLAVSGLLIVPGRRGLSGRGGILATVGLLLPLLYLWLSG